MTIRQKLQAIWGEARVDLEKGTARHLLAFWVTVLIFAVDVPFHEAILGIIGGNVLRSTNNPLWVGAAVGGTSFVIETLMSTGVSVNLKLLSRATRKWEELFFGEDVSRRRADKSAVQPWKSTVVNGLDNAVLALSLGPSVVVLKTHGHAINRRVIDDVRTGVLSSAFVGTFNFFLASAIAGSALLSKAVGFPQGSEVLIAIATNPLTYIGLLVVRQSIKFASSRRSRATVASEEGTRSEPVYEVGT